MNKVNIGLEARFQRLFLTYIPKVRKFAMMLLKSEAEAEDVAQEVFLKLWTHPDVWEKDDKCLNDYIFIIARNHIFNILRHKKISDRYRDISFDESFIYEVTGLQNVYEHINCRDIMLLVHLVLEKMPQKRREIFEASRFKGMKNKEIAQKYGLSVRTVEHQIYLALSEMKKILHFFIIFLSSISVTSVFNL